MDIMKSLFYIVMVIWYILYVFLIIKIYIYNSRPYDYEKTVDINTLNISLNDLSLIIYKKIIPELLVATIIKLIDDKKIIIEKEDEDFILIKNCSDKSLSKSDYYVMDLLFNLIGNNKVSIEQISNFCKNNSRSSSFLMIYQIWKKLVYVSSNHNKIFEQKLDYNKAKIIQRTGIILFILNIILKFNYFIGFFIIIPAIFIMIYFYNVSKLTKEYSIYYYSFLSFRGDVKKNPRLLEDSRFFEYSIILKCNDSTINTNKKEFTIALISAIKKSYLKSVFYGNRSIFHK